MKTIRPTVLAAIVLTLLVSLSGCFFAPSTNGGGTTDTGATVSGTTWGGTDSDGDTWLFEFQPDNTVGLTYNGDSYDDTSDTWALAGGNLTITIAFSDGVATMTGPFSGGNSINLDGSQGAATWTVTITKQ